MRQWIPVVVFLITLTPVGLGHTLFGTSAAMLSALVVGLTLSLLSSMIVFSYLGETRFFQQNVLSPAQRVIFHSPEKIFVAMAALLFFCMALSLSYFSNGCIASIQDSVAQLIHARIVLSGHLSLSAYPLPEFFDLGVMINDGRYYSQYPPGHILWLALGEFFGAACAINPLLGALTCIGIFYVAKKLYGQKIARIAGILCLVSPLMLGISSEFMNHATTLFFATLFFLAFIKTLEETTSSWAFIAGFAAAYVAITRPLTAVGIAVPFLFYALYLLCLSPRNYAPRFLLAACGAALPLAMVAGFNFFTTGDVFMLAYQKQPINHYGFSEISASMLQWVTQPIHTPWHGVGMAFNNMNMMHWHLFLWPTSSLVFVLMVFFLRKPVVYEWLLLSTVLSLALFYVPYYFPGGTRFLYEISGILIIFTAYGISRSPEVLGRFTRLHLAPAQVNSRLAFVMLCCALFSAGFTLFMLWVEEGGSQKLLASRTLESRIHKPTLLFMPFDPEYFRLAGIYYPVREGSKIIVATDRGEQNKKLMAIYPAYEAYRASNIGTDTEVWEAIK